MNKLSGSRRDFGRYQTDAWDAKIDRWLVLERRRTNLGYGNYHDWIDDEVERMSPVTGEAARETAGR